MSEWLSKTSKISKVYKIREICLSTTHTNSVIKGDDANKGSFWDAHVHKSEDFASVTNRVLTDCFLLLPHLIR